MTLSDRIEIARALFGTDRQPAASVVRITGVADSDSDDGTVTVTIGEGDPIEVGCIGSVSEGDTVTVHVQDGSAQVIAAEGWGDEINALAVQAQADADTAHTAAEAALTSASEASGAFNSIACATTSRFRTRPASESPAPRPTTSSTGRPRRAAVTALDVVVLAMPISPAQMMP